jgi:hypothetical protein
MGNRSRMRKFRRRCRRAGFVLLMSLVIVVLGVALFFRTEPFESTGGAPLAVPMISGAPQSRGDPEAATWRPAAAAFKAGAPDDGTAVVVDVKA